MTIAELIERVEGASGPDRRLEGDIALALHQVPLNTYPKRSPTQPELWSDGAPGLRARTWMPPTYTASIDAALALVERKLPGWCPRFYKLTKDGGWGADLYSETSDALWRSDRPTAPLAILLSLLRALQASDPTNAGGER